MNNLEKEILEVLIKNHIQSNTSITAKAVAETCLKWIEKAYNGGFGHGYNWEDHGYNPERTLQNWLKDSGLTPTEPDTKEPVNGGTIESPMPALYNQAQRTIPGEIYTIGSNGVINGDYKEDV